MRRTAEDEVDGPERIELTPQACVALSEDLSDVLDALERWSIRVLDVSRLRRSQVLLYDVGAAGSFPADPGKLSRIANAIWDAHDFRYISSCLPPQRLEPIARDLQKAVGGTISRNHPDRTPYQFQSEFVVATAFAFGGAEPVFPTSEEHERPEFFVTSGTRNYGVEVKRPGSWAKGRRAIRKAARQLASPGIDFGLAVVDVTECVSSEVQHIVSGGRSEAVFDSFKAEVNRLGGALEDQIWNDRRRCYRPDGASMAALITVARSSAWFLDDLSHPSLVPYMRIATFNPSPGRTLRWHRTQWLIKTLLTGMTAAGYRMEYGSFT